MRISPDCAQSLQLTGCHNKGVMKVEHLGTILVGLIIAGMIALAVRSLFKTRNAGGCPGGAGGSSGSTPKKNKPEKPVDLTDYPYEMNVRIDGMTCEQIGNTESCERCGIYGSHMILSEAKTSAGKMR